MHKSLNLSLELILKKDKVLLTLLVIGSLAIRLALLVILDTYHFPTDKSMGAEMGWLGKNLTDGNGFKLAGRDTAWMAPIYPYIVAFIFRSFGSFSFHSGIALILFESLTSALVSLLLYFLGTQLFNRRIGYLSALLWMVLPGPILFSIKEIWSSTLTALGVVLMILLFYQLSIKLKNKFIPIICGLTIGVTVLNDPVVLSILPLGIIWLIWYLKDYRKYAYIHASLIAISTAMVISPWLYREYQTFGEIIPIKDTFGMNFWLGNCCANINQPTAGLNGDHRLVEMYTSQDLAYLNSLNEPDRHQILMDRALQFVSTNPDIFVSYTIQRVFLFWRHTPVTQGTPFDRVLIGIIPLVGLGILMSWKYWRKTLLPVSIFVFYPIPFYLSIANLYRFRLPIEGLMYIFVAYTLNSLLSLITSWINLNK